MKNKYLIMLTSLLFPNLAFASMGTNINQLIFLLAIIVFFVYVFFRKKYKKEADVVGANLHKQIFSALSENEELASKRLNSPFVVGYLYSFISMAFIQLIPSNKRTDFADKITSKHMKYICNGVLPKKLWKIVKSQITGQQACIYQGGNKTYELMIESWCPRQYKCLYDPGQEPPNIDKVMESLRSVGK